MAAITLDAYSTQMTRTEVNQTARLNDQRDQGGRVRAFWFDYTHPSGGADLAAGSYIILQKLPKGARILDFVADSNNNEADAEVAFGIVPVRTLDDTNDDALVTQAANADGSIRHVIKEQAIGTLIDEESYIVALAETGDAGDGLAAGKYIKGYVLAVI